MNLINTVITHEWERVVFPESECIHPDPREPDVRLSTTRYACIVVDQRFDDHLEIVVAIPYTCKALPEDGGGTLYGWTRPDGKQYWDHHERAIHDDPGRVVAWRTIAP